VAVDSSGNVYVSDLHNNRIQKFTSDGTFITKWGTEGSGNGQFRYPWGVALDSSGRVYLADDHNYRIQVFLWKLNVLNPIELPIAGFK
jgi:tripartite motif-containing protein 71